MWILMEYPNQLVTSWQQYGVVLAFISRGWVEGQLLSVLRRDLVQQCEQVDEVLLPWL